MRYMLALMLAVLIATAQSQRGAHHERPQMDNHFDPERAAKSFDDPERDGWQQPDRVISALGLRPGDVVADIGAGTGYFAVRLARHAAAPKVYAPDIEAGMVDYLKKRAAKEGLKNITAVQATAASPNLPEPVDLVLIVNTYHHIGEREKYFRRLGSSLKSGGRLAIIDFKMGAPGGPPDHFRFTPEEIQAELQRAGFELQARHDFLPRQSFLILRRAK